MKEIPNEYDVTEEIMQSLAAKARAKSKPQIRDSRPYNPNLTGRTIDIVDKDGNVISVKQTKGIPKPKNVQFWKVDQKNMSELY